MTVLIYIIKMSKTTNLRLSLYYSDDTLFPSILRVEEHKVISDI